MAETNSKNWVTVKVPEDVRDIVRENAPSGKTYGDCLIAGIRSMNNKTEQDNDIDAERIANEVWEQADTPELSEKIAEQVAEKLR